MPICTICRDSGPLEQFRVFVECGHGFHADCIWGLQSNACPNCRGYVERVRSIKVHLTFNDAEAREAERAEVEAIEAGAIGAVEATKSVREARATASTHLKSLEEGRWATVSGYAQSTEEGAVGGVEEGAIDA